MQFKTLTKAEEQVMQVLWRLQHAFVKDIVDAMPNPKPHYNTVSTILKILTDKGFASFESFGKSNRFFPVVLKDEYSRKSISQFVGNYFNGSFAGMLSFFAKEKDINIKELEALLEQLKKNDKK